MKEQHSARFLYPAIIFVVAFLIRMVPVMNLPFDRGVEGVGNDSVNLALSLLENRRFSEDYDHGDIRRGIIKNDPIEEIIPKQKANSTGRMPLYSVIVACMLKIQGSLGMKIFQCVQILSDSAAAVIIYMVLLTFVSSRMSLIGGLIYAVWLPFIQFSFTIHDGAFTMFINALFLYLIVKYFKKNRFDVKQALYAGLLTAISVMMRPDAIWLPLYLSVTVALFLRVSLSQKIKVLVVYYLFVALLVSPWVIRNTFFYNKFVVTFPSYPIALWEGLGDFPDLLKEYSHLNYDSAICPFARENGYQGPCNGWSDKETQIQLGAFLGSLFFKDVVLGQPLKYASFITIKWLRFFFAHRHFTATGQMLGLPVGPMRGLGVGLLMDLIVLPLLLLSVLILYLRSRMFWVIFLFPLVSTFVHVFTPMNEVRYIVSSTVTYPVFIVLLVAAVRFMRAGGKMR